MISMRVDSIVDSQESWEEHIQKVEAYINYEDEYSVLCDRLDSRVANYGFKNLNPAERIYYAVNHFQGVVINGLLDHFFASADSELQDAVAEGFKIIGEPEKSDEYIEMLESSRRGDWHVMTEEELEANGYLDERGLDFIDDELEYKLDEWAEGKGLFGKQATR